MPDTTAVPRTVAEILRDAHDELKRNGPRMSWGPWFFDERTLTLVHRGGYWIPLDQMRHSAAVLGWIGQIAGKTWADNETLGALVRALNDLFGGLRGAFGDGDPVRLLRARQCPARQEKGPCRCGSH